MSIKLVEEGSNRNSLLSFRFAWDLELFFPSNFSPLGLDCIPSNSPMLETWEERKLQSHSPTAGEFCARMDHTQSLTPTDWVDPGVKGLVPSVVQVEMVGPVKCHHLGFRFPDSGTEGK